MCATEIYLLSLKLLKETNENDSEEFKKAQEFSNRVKPPVSDRQRKIHFWQLLLSGKYISLFTDTQLH